MKLHLRAEFKVVATLILVQITSLLLSIRMVGHEVEIIEGGAGVYDSLLFFLLILSTTLFLMIVIKMGFSKYVYLFSEYFGLLFITFFVAAYASGNMIAGGLFSIFIMGIKIFLKSPDITMATSLIMAIGISVLVGITFGPMPIIVLLVLLSVYDFIAVRKTKHMLVLAEDVVEQKGPQILTFQSIDEKIIIGMADIIFPSALFVSAFLNANIQTALLTSIFSITGIIFMFKTMKSEGMPAIPFVSLGIIGYAIGILFL